MIAIKTYLHAGIYKSCGGGETTTHYEWATTGPRNLLAAIARLYEHSASMTRNYGNIGHAGSWIEIDGVKIHEFDLVDVLQDDKEIAKECGVDRYKTRTQKARELIDEIRAGRYRRGLACGSDEPGFEE